MDKSFWNTCSLGGLVLGLALALTGCELSQDSNLFQIANKKALGPITSTGTSGSVQSITVSPSTVNYLLGGPIQHLSVTFIPVNAVNRTVAWSVQPGSKLVVTSTGPSTADLSVAAGTVVTDLAGQVTATSQDGGKISSALVTFTSSTVAVTGISLPSTLNLAAGQSQTMGLTVDPPSATNKNVTWTCSDPAVAVVDATGVLTAKKRGTVVIAATASDGSGVSSNTCAVTVSQPITAITLPTTLSIPLGTMVTPIVTIAPSDATDKSLSWKSDNPAVVMVDSAGLVTAKSLGTATLTARAADGSGVVSGDCLVTVFQPVTSLVLSSNVSVALGQTTTLSVTVNPSSASIKTVTWSSSNLAVATIDSNGVVTAKLTGTSTITALATDGSGIVSNSCVVSVVQPVAGITLPPSLTVNAGATSTLVPTVTPVSASNKSLTWKSSNNAVATVDSLGVVKGIQTGTASITAETTDGSGLVSNACVVLVVQPMTQITMQSTLSMAVGYTHSLVATVYPAGATNQAITWESSDPSVATVSPQGDVSAVGRGFANITVRAVDGSGVFATCDVEVIQKVQGITIPSALTISVGQASKLNAVIVPANANSLILDWARDNLTGFVTVDGDGMVHGVTKGKARVYASSTDGPAVMSNWCDVTVVPVVDSVTINQTGLFLLVGESATLSATITPTDAADTSVIWTSANPAVATVDQATGRVTGIAVGSVPITASAGGVSSQITVQINSTVIPTLGVFPTTGGSAYTGAVITLDRTLFPAVAYRDSSGNGQFTRWTGSSWESLGTFATGVNLGTDFDRSINFSTVVDGTGTPSVAYLNAAREAHVVQWHGTGGWVPLDSWVVHNVVTEYLSLTTGRYTSVINSTQLSNVLFLGMSVDAYNSGVSRTGISVYDDVFSPPQWVLPATQSLNFTVNATSWVSLVTNPKYNYGPYPDYFYVASSVANYPTELWVQDVNGPYNGPIAKATVEAAYITLALDQQNLPWVCYQDVSTGLVVLAKKVGSSLTTVANIGTGDHPAFVMDKQAAGSVAYVAFRDTVHGGRVALWKYENGLLSVVSDDVSGGVDVTNVTMTGGYPSPHIYVMYEASGVITVKDFAR